MKVRLFEMRCKYDGHFGHYCHYSLLPLRFLPFVQIPFLVHIRSNDVIYLTTFCTFSPSYFTILHD